MAKKKTYRDDVFHLSYLMCLQAPFSLDFIGYSLSRDDSDKKFN